MSSYCESVTLCFAKGLLVAQRDTDNQSADYRIRYFTSAIATLKIYPICTVTRYRGLANLLELAIYPRRGPRREVPAIVWS